MCAWKSRWIQFSNFCIPQILSMPTALAASICSPCTGLSLITNQWTQVSVTFVWRSPKSSLSTKLKCNSKLRCARLALRLWVHQTLSRFKNCPCRFASSKMHLNVFCTRLTLKQSSIDCALNVKSTSQRLFICLAVEVASTWTVTSSLMHWSRKLITMIYSHFWLWKKAPLLKLWSLLLTCTSLKKLCTLVSTLQSCWSPLTLIITEGTNSTICRKWFSKTAACAWTTGRARSPTSPSRSLRTRTCLTSTKKLTGTTSKILTSRCLVFCLFLCTWRRQRWSQPMGPTTNFTLTTSRNTCNRSRTRSSKGKSVKTSTAWQESRTPRKAAPHTTP